MAKPQPVAEAPQNFIRHIIDADLAKGAYAGRTWGGQPGPAGAHASKPADPARIRTRFHGPRQDDWTTIDAYARRTRFRGALVARLLALGIRW